MSGLQAGRVWYRVLHIGYTNDVAAWLYMYRTKINFNFIKMGASLSLMLTVLGLVAVGMTSPVIAASPISIVASTPAHSQVGVGVDVLAGGISLQHQLTNGSDPQIYCWPSIDSLTDQAITLSETANASIVHPVYTASWNKPNVVPTPSPTTVSKGSFVLRNVQPGYQLQANTRYTLAVKGGVAGMQFVCSDSQSTLLSSDYSMQFQTGPDTVPPTISNAQAVGTLNNGLVEWSTAELTTGKVEYGTTTSYGQTILSTSAVQDHAIVLPNLQPGTTYYYRITSTDTAPTHNSSQQSGSFATWSMGSVIVSDVTGHEVTIRWTTSVPTDSIIEYGTSPSFGLRSGGTDLIQQHNVRLVHLKSNTNYFFRIKATTADGVAVTQALRFATRDALAGPSPDVITFEPEILGVADEWNRFNLKDFPNDMMEASSSSQASEGAVLSARDGDQSLMSRVSKATGQAVDQYGWLLWYVVPLLIIVALVAAFYLYYKHDLRMNGLRLELKRQSSRQK